MKNTNVHTIKNTKNKTPLTMITAYDSLFAKLFDSLVDIILVGDSLNMSFNGRKDTLSITLDEMIYHTKAVGSGSTQALLIFDMPFGCYINADDALSNAIRVYRETTAHAIKIEGGVEKAPIIKHLVHNGIAVMGHIGLLPQQVRVEGGYKIKGKTAQQVEKLIADAKAVEEAGAFCMVLEGVPSEAAAEVTKSVDIPIIGIGAGLEVDGQVLVWSDMLGFYEEFSPKFVRKYLDGANLIRDAVRQYTEDVKARRFPGPEESYKFS